MKGVNHILLKKLSTIVFLAIAVFSFGQIDKTDTTAVVIAHWKMNEAQMFRVTETTNTTESEKVISSKSIFYDLSIKVIDSTQIGYLLEWKRQNYEITSEDDFAKSLLKMTEDIPFWITTDEFGSSLQVLNWEDVSNEIKSRAEKLKEANKDFPERLKKLNKTIRQASTKASVEMIMIPDALQFLAFHGAKYKFDERIDLQVKVPNNFGGDPLDANSTMIMDQINFTQGTFIIRSSQRINPHQLTAVTYDYLSSLNIVEGELPPFEKFPKITKLIWGGSEIHGNSGWPIYSIETKQTNNDILVTVEERSIELVRDTEK
ncbi:MAG: hypothetical protein AAGA77_17840 [Bacteroidota bacterium]